MKPLLLAHIFDKAGLLTGPTMELLMLEYRHPLSTTCWSEQPPCVARRPPRDESMAQPDRTAAVNLTGMQDSSAGAFHMHTAQAGQRVIWPRDFVNT